MKSCIPYNDGAHRSPGISCCILRNGALKKHNLLAGCILYQASTSCLYRSIKVWRQTLLRPSASTTCLACSVTCPAIRTRLLITVRILRRFTGRFVFGARRLFNEYWPMIRRMLYARTVSSSTSSLVSNLPEGSLSTSMSVFISLWYCSLSPWAWYRPMMSSSE